jgi:RHS repeat-associated protein
MLLNHYMTKNNRKRFFLLSVFFIGIAINAFAVGEPYVNEIKGSQVAKDSGFIVADEKFTNPSAWSLIQQNISVDDILTFEINFDTSVYFYNQPFNCTASFKIYIYGNQSNPGLITDSVTYNNISLEVKYDTITGKPYKGVALYKFKGVHKFGVKILDIASPQLNPIPAIFRVKGQVIVDRKYTFQNASTDVTRYNTLPGNRLNLSWTPSNYPGAEMFDLEYTHIGKSSLIAASIANYASGGEYNVPADSLAKWFKNNSTRITTAASSYLLNLPYDTGFILFRIRGAQIHYPDDVRWEGDWNYSATSSPSCSGSCATGVVYINGHESNLNWQYSAVFAEEGKRKEVISYFDGSLHNRQSVTINNSDNKTVVQETIYDVLGRPAVNILPVPANDSTLHYFRGFNKNNVGNPYSFADFPYLNCNTAAASMSIASGASQYYSENNSFLNAYHYAKYIPKAEGYPFTVTEYKADNTGRIEAQGGVGASFQLNSGHETRYFYGKPSQKELDRLFGVEAGNSSHYLKNMVVDPNGQISVSYINASGKTIATALAGNVPGNVFGLPSSSGASVQVSNDLMKPEDFNRNSADYSISATSTFLAPVTGTYVLDYKVDPLRLEILHGPQKDSVICNSCYYDLDITVKDNCENIIEQTSIPAGTVFDTACAGSGTLLQGTLNADIDKIGEYYVTYRLRVSGDALNFYDSVHLEKNSDIKKLNYFLLDELKAADFTGCYSNCATCIDDLGTKSEFFIKFKSLYTADSVVFGADDSTYALSLYDSLLAHCQAIQQGCGQNVCDERLELLKVDVSPGGQYALYDTTNALLEPQLNVLARRNEIAFFSDEEGNHDYVTIYDENGENPVEVDVKDLNDSLFIEYWEDSWADSLVRFHPEYCNYLWCIANSSSYEFNKEIEDWIDADTAIARGWFNPTNYKALLEKDPFFNTVSGVPGKGVPFYTRMDDSLRLYSRTSVRLSHSDKNILQFIDVVLYCKTQADPWDGCIPDDNCRSRNREWELYKQLYLNLKTRFNEEAKRSDSDTTFANCANCYIGKDMVNQLYSSDTSSLDCDSLNQLVADFKNIYTPVDTSQVYGNKKITQCANELVSAANAIIEAKNTYPNTQLSPDFCFSTDPISTESKLYAVKYNSNNNFFNTIVPLSLGCTLNYTDISNNTVTPQDFCSNAADSAQLSRQYYAVSTKPHYGENSLQVIWSVKNSGTYPFYGVSSPLSKYLPGTANENHVFGIGFIQIPDTVSSYASYLQVRAGLPFIHFDSISKIRDLRFDTEWLPANYASVNDDLNGSVLKVTIDLKNGTSVTAHLRDNYENTGYVKYKELVDSNLYNNNCELAFTTYFNQQKGTNYTFSQIEALYFKACGKPLTICTPYVPFTDSTCNTSCPGGTYNDYTRNNLALYVEYGTPEVAPQNKPSNYTDCQFYPVFDLKTGAATNCRFFNVWVCVLDTCGGEGCGIAGPASYCPENPNADLFKNKVRRYPDYVNTDGFINGLLAGSPAQTSEGAEGAIMEECRSVCEAQSEFWIQTLRRCTTDTVKLEQLRLALIDICANGCSMDRPFGTSSIPQTTPATYHSFDEAIVGILGAGALNDSCTMELLADPYPYNKQPLKNERTIMETDYDICQKLGTVRTEYQASGFTGSLHSYLNTKYGASYGLDSLELEDMIKSCTNCNGILQNDIVLPVVLDPQAGNCQTCDQVEAVFGAFTTKFPSLTTANPDYEMLFANFFNHSLGFALTYDDYKIFLDSCAANNNYASKLCGKPQLEEVESNPVNSCVNEIFSTALTNAYNTYVAYIDSVRRDFRDAYLGKCMNVQPKLTMTAELYEYHYTLYYYDQSGNLVKTIPPEGIRLLNSQELADVERFRLLQNEGCYQYSDSIRFANNGQLQFSSVPSFENGSFTIEGRINLANHSNQVLFSKLAESTISDPDPYRYNGLLAMLENGQLKITLYGTDTSVQKKATALSVLPVSTILPLNSWVHLAVQGTGSLVDPIRVSVNGSAVAIQYSANDITSITDFSNSASLIIASHSAPNLALPGRLNGTIKNFRIYDRLVSIPELRQNAFNNCQLPTANSGLIFWAALNVATNNLVPEFYIQQPGTLTGFTWQPFNGVFNDHKLPTTYQYNSLNQVVQQFSPDGDTSYFWYDRLGRLTASQNKEQQTTASYSGSANRFSYTAYDGLGRIKEVGEKSGATDIRNINMLDSTAVKNWVASGTDRQLTKTIYDEPVSSFQDFNTSRKRVTASIYLENKSDTEGDSTLYNYDIIGNVKTLVQHVKALVAVDATNGKKRIDYEYDLVSGKVNTVSYQQDKGDQFFYKYSYDADNRVVSSLTSRDKLIWTEDASYTYYVHGPLARTELGRYKVQGTDYAYTLQGWLKGINGDALNPTTEIGGDGWQNTTYSRVSRDVYSFKLGYYNNDYKPIGGTGAPAMDGQTYTAPGTKENTGNQLFNGNISYTTLALSKINSGSTTGYTYGYDQLNRLVQMRQHTVTGAWSNSNIISAYSESIAYDANGNILKYLRHGANVSGAPLDMDSLNYNYNRDVQGNLVNNRLNHVRDNVAAGNYTVDIDNQSADNYLYDRIGNLKKDVAESIDNINWTVYGKIKAIDKTSGPDLSYGYDPAGNRTLKQATVGADVTKTFYIRDAQGNTLAIYSKKNADALKWNEQHLYGSSRLGLWQWDTTVPAVPPIVLNNTPIYDSLPIGMRTYELSNHLGNVLATISDKKIGNDSSGVVNYYLAETLSQTDYYPFGMMMQGRSFSAASGYRYGFNGKENDNEVKGEGNQQDYGMRIYDPRLGKFLSVDPISKSYPELTPYQFASNRPIDGIDLDGEEYKNKSYYKVIIKTGSYFDLKTHKIISYQTLDVAYDCNNMPEYFKKAGITPEGAEIAGWDKACYTGSGCLQNKIRPKYDVIKGLSPHSGITPSSMNDAATEPTMQLDQTEIRKGAGGNPQPVTTSTSAKVGAAAEIGKYIGIAWELFSEENKAYETAFRDKVTFYYSINLVNNALADAKELLARTKQTLSPEIDNLIFKSYLINYVNSGALPFTQEQIKNAKSQNNAAEATTMEHANSEVDRVGKLIYEYRKNRKIPEKSREKGAVPYGSTP